MTNHIKQYSGKELRAILATEKPELTESQILAGMNFDKVKKKAEVNEIQAEINKIENEMTIIRLSQMSIEYCLQRVKILAKGRDSQEV